MTKVTFVINVTFVTSVTYVTFSDFCDQFDFYKINVAGFLSDFKHSWFKIQGGEEDYPYVSTRFLSLYVHE